MSGVHRPEEWGPSNNRRLTCPVCGVNWPCPYAESNIVPMPPTDKPSIVKRIGKDNIRLSPKALSKWMSCLSTSFYEGIQGGKITYSAYTMSRVEYGEIDTNGTLYMVSEVPVVDGDPYCVRMRVESTNYKLTG